MSTEYWTCSAMRLPPGEVFGYRLWIYPFRLIARYSRQVINDVASQQSSVFNGTSNGADFLLKPVVLVTPSASGYSMVSWIMDDTVSDDARSEMSQYVKAWIPVAAVHCREPMTNRLRLVWTRVVLTGHYYQCWHYTGATTRAGGS